MSRRRFTTEELEAIAVKEKLALATRRSLMRELSSFIYRGALLVMCVFKRDRPSDLTRDLQLPPPTPERDRLLRPSAAIESLGVSRQYIYDHERELPFCVRLQSEALRISEQRMFAWIEGLKCADSGTCTCGRGRGITGSDTASTENSNTKARSRPGSQTPSDS